MGEKGPYKDIKLLDEDVDPTRTRALLAFASAKHERLFSLLDRREFDYLDVIAPSKNTSRSEVAFFAADFICQNYQNAKVTRIDTNDLLGLVQYLDERYIYFDENNSTRYYSYYKNYTEMEVCLILKDDKLLVRFLPD